MALKQPADAKRFIDAAASFDLGAQAGGPASDYVARWMFAVETMTPCFTTRIHSAILPSCRAARRNGGAIGCKVHQGLFAGGAGFDSWS